MKNFYPRIIIASLIVIIIYVLLFIFLDRPVAYAAFSASDNALYKLSFVYQYIGAPAIWLTLSLLGLILFGYQRLRHHSSSGLNKLAFVCASVFLGGTITTIIKIVLARYRPIELFTHNEYGFHFFSMHNAFNSTPSGHTTVAFAVAMSLSFLFRRYCGLFFLFACLVACSRVLIDQHFVSDVVLGAYIGIISTLIIKHHFSQLIQKSE